MADWLDSIMQANASMSPRAQADTEFLKSQTTGQDITNQQNALTLDFQRQFMSGQTGAAPPPSVNQNATAEQEGDLALDSGKARAALQQRFQPVPDVWTPDEQKSRVAAVLSRIPGAADVVKAQHDARIQNARQQQMHDATQMYSHLYGVANAPDGQAMNVLELEEPETAARFRQAGMTDEQVRQHASDLAGLTHSVAELPIEFRGDGVAVDGRTKEEIPGYDSAVGMGAKDRAELIDKLQEPTKIPGTTPGTEQTVPKFKAIYGPDAKLEDVVRRTTNMANAHRVPPSAAASAVAAATPGAPARAPAPAAAAAPGAPGAAPGAAPRPAVTGPAQVKQAALASIPQAERSNYTNPDYQLPPPPPVKWGQSAPPEVVEENKAIAKARTDLLGEQSLNSAAAGQALRYYKLANDVLATGGVTTGWSADHISQVSAALTQLGIPADWLGDPSKAAQLTKALTNAGLQDLRAKFGSKIAQSEVFLNLNKASPNIDMPLPALKHIIQDQIDNMTYTVQSGQRANKYLATGNDPRKFDTWNEATYPRQNAGATNWLRGKVVSTQAAYDALPKGAPYIANGKQHWKGGR